MDRITIVGIGPIGASMGLGLKRSDLRNTEIVGTSGDRNALSEAAKMGAVDSTTRNLRSAVRGAELVILDAPLSETRELLEALGPILDDGCVVTDTGTTKIRVMDWADEYLPKGISFVGGHPLPKKPLNSMSEADPSVFDGIEYCVIPAVSASRGSVRTVVALVEKLGARTVFLDPHEHDSYAAAMMYLPVVLSSAFVTATAGSNAWREMHRLAAFDFADFSRLASNDPEDNEVASLANPDALVHWLDEIIAELYSYRNLIKDRSPELLDTFIKAWEARARWEANVVLEDDETKIQRRSMASFVVGERIAERFDRVSSDDKKNSWKYSKKL